MSGLQYYPCDCASVKNIKMGYFSDRVILCVLDRLGWRFGIVMVTSFVEEAGRLFMVCCFDMAYFFIERLTELCLPSASSVPS